MTGPQLLIFILLLALAASAGFLVCRAVPYYIVSLLCERLTVVRAEVDAMRDRYGDNSKTRDLQIVSEFLRVALSSEGHIGLSAVLAVLTYGVRGRAHLPTRRNGSKGIEHRDRKRLQELEVMSVRLVLLRELLGSALWFAVIPITLWVAYRFRYKKRNRNNEYNPIQVLATLGEAREIAHEDRVLVGR